MGLDIRAFRNLRTVENPVLNEGGYPEDRENQWKPGGSMKWSESVWPGKGSPINADAVYEWESEYNFQAGSYSYYNIWRDQLRDFKGKEAFQELIDFADNEGVIGTVLSIKLRDDFQRHYNEAVEYSKTLPEMHDDWFIMSYKNWMKAFEMAAVNGAIEFG